MVKFVRFRKEKEGSYVQPFALLESSCTPRRPTLHLHYHLKSYQAGQGSRRRTIFPYQILLFIALFPVVKAPAQSTSLRANPSQLHFGDVIVGRSSTFTGTHDMTIFQATQSGAASTPSGLSLPLTVPAGQNTTFNATVNPTAAGAFNGSLLLVSNGTSAPS